MTNGRWRAALLFIVGCAFLETACDEACNPATYSNHCEGATAVQCARPPGSPAEADEIVVRQECSDQHQAKVCVKAPTSGAAFCAVKASPDSRCSDPVKTHACSTETQEVWCRNGFLTYEATCLACTLSAINGRPVCKGGATSACSQPGDCVSGVCSSSGVCGSAAPPP